ncbi:MAG: PilZ domain-containing protein [bacterium]|nr:PilZ domain-containing protein [bacterium]
MKLLETLGLKRKAPANIKSMLPSVNGWVDLHCMGTTAFSVCVEEIHADSIVTSRPDKGQVRPGCTGTFVYTNAQGKFRFASRFLGEDARGRLRFAMPGSVTSLAAGGNQRTAVRLDATVQGMWRMAAGGKGVGPLSRATIRDISIGGLALILPCELRKGQEVEVQVPLGPGTVLQVVCEVRRVEGIERAAKFSHGLKFRALSQAQERQVNEFIHRRQTDLRARGLA